MRTAQRGRVTGACARWIALVLPLAIVPMAATAAAAGRSNHFGDPFEQATGAIAGCAEPEGPLQTDDEARREAHARAERGTTCFLSGRCRLPNSYLYDKEIAPRVKRLIQSDPRFSRSSLWILGQRRWVFVMGCVASRTQGRALEQAIRGVDDVEAVIGQWTVGASRNPPYRVARPPAAGARR